jgi:hypothetical protein
MKSYFGSRIPFLSLFCNCQFRDSTHCNSSAPKLIPRLAGVWKLEPSLPNTGCYYYSTTFYTDKHFARTPQKTASIVKEACLLIRCLAMVALILCPLVRAGYVHRVVTRHSTLVKDPMKNNNMDIDSTFLSLERYKHKVISTTTNQL